jgi:hypothetical protein
MASPSGTFASLDRTSRTTRTNRLLLGLLGLVLLAAGAGGLALGLGVFGSRRADQPVISNSVTDTASHRWFWPLVAVAAAIIAVLALRWLLVQTRTDRVRAFDLEADRSRGRTILQTGAVVDAVSEEVRGYRGVTKAHTSVRGSAGAPELVLRTSLDGRAPARDVAERVVTETAPHTREALDAPELPVRLEMRLAPRTRRSPL